MIAGHRPHITNFTERLSTTVNASFPAALLREWAGCLMIFGLFLGIAYRHAWLATHDLEWPYDIDLFRDAALAHNVAAGEFPADAHYIGEQNWYNPLPAFLIAGIARLLSTDPFHVYAQHGALIGLMIPVAFFWLGVALVGRWAALGAVFAFLFLRPQAQMWSVPSYSPWLFANVLSLAPMALCVGLALRARSGVGTARWAVCGAALGVTFLAHTAAAIIAGCIALAVGFTRRWLVALRRYTVVIGVAFIVSLPFAMTILLHYKLHIRNPSGQGWLSDETTLAQLPDFLRASLTTANAVAVWGGVALARNPAMSGTRRVLFTWLGVSGLLLAYGYFRQTALGWSLPSIVPPFHWLFQLRVVRALLFGFGLYSALIVLMNLAKPWPKFGAPLALCAVLFGLLGWNYRRYTALFDFRGDRGAALAYSKLPGFAATVGWLRANTPADTVILTDPTNAVTMSSAAYRHAVVLDVNFSNPYVLLDERARAAEAMFTALEMTDEWEFRALAAKYGVGYVLLCDVTSSEDRRLASPFAEVVFASGNYRVLALR